MKCPDCDGRIKFQQTNCQDCGRNLGDLDFEQLQNVALQKKRKIVIAILAGSIFLGGGVLAKGILDDRREKQIAVALAEEAKAQAKAALEAEKLARAREISERNDYSWVPSGFRKFSVNNNMAYKTISYDAADCYSNCWGFTVISRDYCSTIRVEANIVRGDVILDTGSDSASEIPARTRAIMRITSSADLPWSASITEASCT